LGGQRAKETVGGALEVAKGNSALESSKDVGVKGADAEEVTAWGGKGGAFEKDVMS